MASRFFKSESPGSGCWGGGAVASVVTASAATAAEPAPVVVDAASAGRPLLSVDGADAVKGVVVSLLDPEVPAGASPT